MTNTPQIERIENAADIAAHADRVAYSWWSGAWNSRETKVSRTPAEHDEMLLAFAGSDTSPDRGSAPYAEWSAMVGGEPVRVAWWGHDPEKWQPLTEESARQFIGVLIYVDQKEGDPVRRVRIESVEDDYATVKIENRARRIKWLRYSDGYEFRLVNP